MNLDGAFRINSPEVINQVIEGEAVIINLKTGNYYSLDRLGAEIWKRLERGRPVSGILADIARRYQGGREEIEAAVRPLLERLRQEELIVADPSPPERSSGGQEEAAEEGEEPAAPGRPEDRLPLETPVLNKYTDMQDLLLLDPIHEVDEAGWPEKRKAR